jgi:hypothetical protein
MKARDLSHHYIGQQLGVLRQACQGSFPNCNIDLVHEGKWCLKHPDRLVLQDAMGIIALLKDKGEDTYAMKRALKDFLTSKGIVIGKKIAVGKPKSYGKLAKLFVDRTILDDVLEWVKSQNFEAYVADDFMFKTGTRLTATLNALVDNINFEQHTIRVYDKARRSLYPEGKEWEKQVSQKLWQNIMTLLGDRRAGKIFQSIKNHDLEIKSKDEKLLKQPKEIEGFEREKTDFSKIEPQVKAEPLAAITQAHPPAMETTVEVKAFQTPVVVPDVFKGRKILCPMTNEDVSITEQCKRKCVNAFVCEFYPSIYEGKIPEGAKIT